MFKKSSLNSRKEQLVSIAIVFPSIALVAVFIYGFIGNTIFISLTDWHGLSENPVTRFVGLANYRTLFTSITQIRFRQDFLNALFYSLFLIAGTISLGLLLAVLLDRSVKNERFFKTVFLYPMALSFIVTGTIWRWLLAPNGGLNVLPTFFGFEKIGFLWTSSRTTVLKFNWQNIFQVLFAAALAAFVFLALRSHNERKEIKDKRKTVIFASLAAFSFLYVFVIHRFMPTPIAAEEVHGLNLATVGIMLAGIWQYSGYTMALYLAGLRALPSSLREAAQIDGANEFTYYRKIALPNVKPITLSAFIILTHISLKMFDLIFAMAGPDNANTGHPSINMYMTTFRANDFAAGASIAVIMFLLAAVFIIPYLVHNYRTRGE